MENIKVTRDGKVWKIGTIGLPGHPRFGERTEMQIGTVRKLDRHEVVSGTWWTAERGYAGRGNPQRTFQTRKDAVAWLAGK